MPGMVLLFSAACILPLRGINGDPEKSKKSGPRKNHGFLRERRNKEARRRPANQPAVQSELCSDAGRGESPEK